jgi:hypothetical protein
MSPDVIDLIFDNQIKEEEEVIMSIVDCRLAASIILEPMFT